MRSWVIGSGSDCDVVVDSPLASARHCQLTETPSGFMLDDLGSTNGTFVNGLRINAPTRATPGEPITLGRTVPMPWPPELLRYVRIGRAADNDVVLDDARVSGHHARLIVVADSETLIEDLGSSNGTFLNSADRRVTGATPLSETDTLYFGTLAVTAARLLPRPRQTEQTVPPAPSRPAAGPPPIPGPIEVLPLANSIVEIRTEQTVPPAPSRPAAGPPPIPGPIEALPLANSIVEIRWTLALLAQAPILAILIVLMFGRHAAAPITAASWASVGQGIASTTFALALTAIWFGCSSAVAEFMAGRLPDRQARVDTAGFFVSLGARLAVLVLLCAVGCELLLAIVCWGSGLKGPWLAIWGVLVMASLVGLLLGLVVTSLVRNRRAAVAVLLVCFVSMTALGGWIWRLPGMIPPIRLAAAAMPSRWAFEGLFLVETAEHPPPNISAGSDLTPNLDLAESYFPANSERMGPRADVMALGSMLIGLAAITAFIWGLWRPGP